MIDNSPNPGLMMVDDNALAASALERRFTQSSRLRWLGWTDDPPAAVAMVQRRDPAVLLLDVDMPGFDGFALLHRLVEACPETAVVMFSGHASPALIERALQGGAAGYIHKDETIETITDLLLRAAEGELVLSPLASGSYMLAKGQPTDN